MPDAIVHEDPSSVESAPDEVLVSGPDGVAVSMTPEAAAKTGARLLDAAAAARGEGAMQADLSRREARRAQRAVG